MPMSETSPLTLAPGRSTCPTPAAQAEFQDALQAYRISSGRMFPTWSEVLEVLRGLGYEKAEASREQLRAS